MARRRHERSGLTSHQPASGPFSTTIVPPFQLNEDQEVDEEEEEEDSQERSVEQVPSSTLPVGQVDMPQEEFSNRMSDGTSEKVAALIDGWERRTTVDGTEYINRRDFRVPDGAVPQGTVRQLDEAYALEIRRCG